MTKQEQQLHLEKNNNQTDNQTKNKFFVFAPLTNIALLLC